MKLNFVKVSFTFWKRERCGAHWRRKKI